MIFIDNYDSFKYTKIQVPITLNKCPSDYDCSEYYIDVKCESFSQQGCYVGNQRIKKLYIHRIKAANNGAKISEPKWLVELVICGVKSEDEVIQILDCFCEILTLNCARQDFIFCNSGMYGFSFREMEIKRRYATEDQVFGDVDFNYRCGMFESRSLNTINNNIFELPQIQHLKTPLFQELSHAFLTALRSTDPVARYILLYYLFEIIYRSEEYRQTRPDIKRGRSRCRNLILYDYLKQRFQINSYFSFDGELELTPEVLERIILTRDKLAHAADTSEISEVMYHHMIPILQQVIRSLDNELADL